MSLVNAAISLSVGAGAYYLGILHGRATAISNLRSRIDRNRRDGKNLSGLLEDSSPRLRSAVIKPTASPRTQVELDDDYR